MDGWTVGKKLFDSQGSSSLKKVINQDIGQWVTIGMGLTTINVTYVGSSDQLTRVIDHSAIAKWQFSVNKATTYKLNIHNQVSDVTDQYAKWREDII